MIHGQDSLQRDFGIAGVDLAFQISESLKSFDGEGVGLAYDSSRRRLVIQNLANVTFDQLGQITYIPKHAMGAVLEKKDSDGHYLIQLFCLITQSTRSFAQIEHVGAYDMVEYYEERWPIQGELPARKLFEKSTM